MADKFPSGELPILYNLPPELAQEVGGIISKFAYIEHLLSGIIYALLNIGPKEGRLSVREPRANERLEIISDLLELRNIPVSIELGPIRSEIQALESRRNKVAHGIWLHNTSNNIIVLRHVKGEWQPEKGMRGKVKRIIYPEGIPFGIEEAKALTNDITTAVHKLIELNQEIQGKLRAFPQKPL